MIRYGLMLAGFFTVDICAKLLYNYTKSIFCIIGGEENLRNTEIAPKRVVLQGETMV